MKKLVGVLFLLALAGCGISSQVEGVPHPSLEPVNPKPTVVEVPDPKFISIPSIGAESDLIPTGVAEDGKLEVPPIDEPMQASWYEGFPEPGEPGRPAVILGHVDGGGERGVFYDLKKVKVNDTVIVDSQIFSVYKVETYPKESFPTGVVYAPSETPELRLITCGGTFGGDRAGHYDDNVVVYAHMVSRQ